MTNIPLGILNDVGYDQLDIDLAAGDLVLAYTDSLIEARCADGEEVGRARLLEALSRVDATSPDRIVAGLLGNLAAIGAATNDDVTILLARSDGKSRGAGFFARLAAQVRFLGQAATFRRDVPWPEWTSKNVGGAITSSLPRWRRR